jgi:G3E family GTPase
VATQYSKLDLKETLNTGLFDMKDASSSPGWLQFFRENTTSGSAAHNSEADEYGVTSFVYRARRPFHPNRIGGWIYSIMLILTKWKRITPKERHKASKKSDPKQKLMEQHYGTILGRKDPVGWPTNHLTNS